MLLTGYLQTQLEKQWGQIGILGLKQNGKNLRVLISQQKRIFQPKTNFSQWILLVIHALQQLIFINTFAQQPCLVSSLSCVYRMLTYYLGPKWVFRWPQVQPATANSILENIWSFKMLQGFNPEWVCSTLLHLEKHMGGAMHHGPFYYWALATF